MKKLFSLLSAVLVASAAWAATTVTFVAGTDVASEQTTLEKDGITLTIAAGTSTTGAGYLSRTDQYRIYKGNILTISSTVGNITNVEFTCTASGTSKYGPGNFTVTDGEYTTSEKVGTWTGSAESIDFTASGAQVRATQIAVTFDDGAAQTKANNPTISPSSQSFNGSLEVTITANDDNATIMYSTDGENYSEYTEALTLTETTTVYAYAVVENLENSDVVSATYTLMSGYETLAEVNTLDDATDFAFNGSAVVAWQQGSYLWLRDGNTNGLIYGSVGLTYSNGDVLPAGWSATKTSYKGLLEYTNATGLAAATETATCDPYEYTISDVTTDNMNAYAVLYGLTISYTSGNSAYGINADGDSVIIYNSAKITYPTFVETSTYDVYGFVSVYNSTAQFIPVNFVEHAAEVVVSTPYFSPEATTFYTTQTVTINDSTEGVTIYYSFDGENFEEYTSVLTLTETTTVYAYAVDADGNKSATASATYTLGNSVDNIEEALALGGTYKAPVDFMFNGDVVIAYQNGANIWIRDNSGSCMIYDKDLSEAGFSNGEIIEAGWIGQQTMNYDVPEFINVEDFAASGETTTCDPFEYTTTEVTADKVNEYIKLSGVNIVADTTALTYYADSLMIYNKFGIEMPELDAEKTYEVVGVVTIFKDVVEVYPISVTEVADHGYKTGDVNHDGIVNVDDVAALIGMILGNGEGCEKCGDVNGDNIVNVDDVAALIGLILGNN